MTPLALAAIRAAREAGDQASFDTLCSFQWFDVTAIEPMIDIAIEANRSIEALAGRPMPPFNERARLPAKASWIEAKRPGGRCAWVCTEMEDGAINVRLVTPTHRYPRVIFEPGSSRLEAERSALWGRHGRESGAFIAEQVESILTILNQPGLVEGRKMPSHKREVREAVKRGHAIGDVGLWTVCSIRPGRHGLAYGGAADEPTRPLHHVRKHFKPRQSERCGRPVWIEDYWRGDASLGLIHKTYVLQQPVKDAA